MPSFASFMLQDCAQRYANTAEQVLGEDIVIWATCCGQVSVQQLNNNLITTRNRWIEYYRSHRLPPAIQNVFAQHDLAVACFRSEPLLIETIKRPRAVVEDLSHVTGSGLTLDYILRTIQSNNNNQLLTAGLPD